LNERRVRFTLTARRQIDLEHQWWLEHRDQRQLFEDELGAAINLLALLPGIGTPYELSPLPGIRRLYLDNVACHLYYTYDDEWVIIRSLWGARRGRGPSLTA
jgi:plasmid stabilization system protein ParE